MNWLTTKAKEFDAELADMPEWFSDIFGGSLWDMIVQNTLQFSIIAIVGWAVATWFERRHFREMDEREVVLDDITLSTLKNVNSGISDEVMLLTGSVVISHDYFRTLLIIIKKIIGGNIFAYERLINRARREAIIRLKEEARVQGMNKIINIRFGSALVGPKFLTAIEMVAYGTGVKTTGN